MQKKWNIKHPNPKLQADLSNSLSLHPIVAQLLLNRGISTSQDAKDFLSINLSSLHDPLLFADMDKTLKRIHKAKEKKERVLIFGDYDVDGITSSVILKNILQKIGLDVINYIPHRINEGYGLNHAIVDFAKKRDVRLMIAIDCGITAFSEVDALNNAGIDVIIMDHHEPPEKKLPNAVAVINPKRHDCKYPFKGLASVGLAFKLAQALLGKACEDYLDLVALGTVADVAELLGENRVFVKFGLEKLSHTKNKGLMALMDVARIKGKKLKPHSIGFVLGPRINASGRMGSAEKSLQLLLSEEEHEAYSLAKSLEEENQKRQKMQGNIIEEALSVVEREINFKDHRIIVLSKEGWHRGIVGIVASRIMDTFYRPTIVISLEDGLGTGSARSIDGFHMYEALKHCEALLENFGGHEHAAGLTIKKENIENFNNLINQFAKDHMDVQSLIPTLDIDCEISLSSLTLELVEAVKSLEPFGEGNPSPVFCSRQLTVKTPPVILGRDTIKFWVSDGKVVLQAVGFGLGRFFDLVSGGTKLDLAYAVSTDDWNKDPIIQLEIKDIKEAD
ncbi:MAG: single-stranded-DNA-specific exonuclease RecJ [Candidatus Omnitrophota bacterium]